MIIYKPSMKRFNNLKVFNINGTEYVLPEAAAHAIGCAVRTIRHLINEGRLKGNRHVFGGKTPQFWLIECDSLKEFIEKYLEEHPKK